MRPLDRARECALHLELDHLSCRRGDRWLYRDLNTGLEHGNILILQGRNGSGKSTLLRHIGGLLTAEGTARLLDEAGEIAAAGEEMASVSHYIGHDDAMKAGLTVAENISFWQRLFGDATKVVDPLTVFELAALRHLQTGLLSEGQRKRVGLTRLVLAERPLWLLDEPLPTLDEETMRRLIQLIRDHCDRGGLAVIATHRRLEGLDGKTLVL